MEITLGELAALLGGTLEGPADRAVSGIKGIEDAGPAEVAFLANPKYAPALPQCRAGVVLVGRDQQTPAGLAVIRVDNPYLAYAQLLTKATQLPYQPLGVHPRAVVEESALLGDGVSVHALAYVGESARLGERVQVHPGACLGPGVKVGDDTVIHANVSIGQGCVIGQRCIIHSGTVIGADGYGFAPDGEKHFKIPQVGIVQIDDDVEIGALCTVDRAATGRTWIHSGVKTDNMVHIAHNCEVGENTLLVAQVGISGSTKVGMNVMIGGQAGLAGHITVGDGAMIGGGTGVIKPVEPGDVVSGVPAMPHRLWLRTGHLIRRLPELFKKVKDLEKRLQDRSASQDQE